MLIILLLFFLVFPHQIFAADPVVKITDFSSNSNPEWIQLTNTTNGNINLENWYFEDDSKTKKNINICLSPNSYKTIEFTSGWLNNGGDTINLYNKNGELIDTKTYATGTEKNKINDSSVCVLPTPTTDPTVINPTSGISISEFMPYSSIEWIEIYNQNNFNIKLIGWQIGDNSSVTKTIPDLLIAAKSFGTFDFSNFLNNTDADKIVLFDNNKTIIDSYNYYADAYELEKSWSKVSGSWCKADLSKGKINNDCSESIPTPTPTKTPTPTPTLSPTPTPTPTVAPTIIITPEITASILTPTPSGSILGEATVAKTATKKNFLPLVFIIGGGVLLLSPLIVTKIKRK